MMLWLMKEVLMMEINSESQACLSHKLPRLWHKRSPILLECQAELLRMIATGRALSEVLSQLIHFLEKESRDALCSIVIVDQTQKDLMRCAAAPSLPADYNAAVDGLPIGPEQGSCGTAIYRREKVEVYDIATDPLWANFRDFTLQFGLRACVSVPILDSRGVALGSFAFYYRYPRYADPFDLELMYWYHDLAGIAIERSNYEAEQKTRLKEEQKSRQEAERLNSLKDEFLSVASHELRSPLATLKMHFQVFEMSLDENLINLKSELEKFLTQGNRHIDRISRLVKNLLDVSSFRHKDIKLHFELVNLTELLRSLLRPYEGVNFPPIFLQAKESIVGQWDKARLEQVFINLIENAIKYGENKPVTIRIEKQGFWALVEVTDLGIGISLEQQQRIFNRFDQAQSRIDVTGLGLGLYIVKQIVQAHSGLVDVRSQVGKGATMLIKLPMLSGGGKR